MLLAYSWVYTWNSIEDNSSETNDATALLLLSITSSGIRPCDDTPTSS